MTGTQYSLLIAVCFSLLIAVPGRATWSPFITGTTLNVDTSAPAVMIEPVNQALPLIYRRVSFDQIFRLTLDGLVVDLSDKQLLSQLWDLKRTVKYADFTVLILYPTDGVFQLKLDATVTATLPGLGVYDVKVLNADGTSFYGVKGSFTVKEGYSDAN